MTRRTGMLAPPGRLRIDLDAVAGNWRRLNALAPSAGVVKADAYGLGMERVAPALHRAGCRTFFVAGLDEGAALRALLPDADSVEPTFLCEDGRWRRYDPVADFDPGE